MGLTADRRDGSAVAASDFALGAGWGASTFAVTAGSTDQEGQIVITGVTGGGLAQATSTVTLTFKDGAFRRTPQTMVFGQTDNALTEAQPRVGTNTTTTMILISSVLPVNTKIYTWNYRNICTG
jgi:hypothetical protein